MTDNEEQPPEVGEGGAADGLMPAQPGVAAVAGAGVALAPLAAYGPIGAAFVAVLTPATAAILQGAVYEFTQLRGKRAAKLIKDAAGFAEIDAEELLRRIGNDPAKLMLLSDAMQAASRTSLDGKIRLLSKALAEGALTADDALIDEQVMLVAAVADLEAPHLQALKIIADGTERAGYMGAERRGISEMTIARSRRGLEGFGGTSLLQPLLRVLDRNGLIYQTRTGEVWDENIADDIPPDAGSKGWAATRFAQSLLLMLLDSDFPKEK